MEFRDVQDFKLQTIGMLEEAFRWITKNTNTKVLLSDEIDIGKGSHNTWLLNFTVLYPSGDHDFTVGNLTFKNVHNAAALPRLYDLFTEDELETLKTRLPEKKFITLCLAGWIYAFGRKYGLIKY